MRTLEEQLIAHFGLRPRPERDDSGTLILGVGRKIEEVGLSYEEAFFLLGNDLTELNRRLPLEVEGWYALGELRQRVLIDLAHEIRIEGVRNLPGFLEAIAYHDFPSAARALMQTAWAHQDVRRARRLAKWLEMGRES